MKDVQEIHIDPTIAVDLLLTIEQIGVARFVGRINAGAIPSEEGYAALETFVDKAKRRPLISRLTGAMLGHKDSYST